MIPKNRITAAMLAFFTGFIGGHHLYLGKTGKFIGFIILMMISFSINFPLSMIFGIIAGIKLLNMSDREFDRKYNAGMPYFRQGPLEARREAQMRTFDQMPQGNRPSKKTPLATAKANPYKNSGIKKYKDFDLEDAISDFKKGLEISPNDLALHFNIACAYSLTENKKLAYHHLSKAVSLGLKDINRILNHDDLAFVRIQPEFDQFKEQGFKVNPFGQMEHPASTPNQKMDSNEAEMSESLLSQLNNLAEMHKNGVLSEEDFIFERRKILRQ